MDKLLEQSTLGKKAVYPETYTASVLFPIPRAYQRQELGLTDPLPFHGIDIWNAYELAWLNPKGKPVVAMGRFIVPCTSTHLFEAKSLKLYLHSFNQTKFESEEEVRSIIARDLSEVSGANVGVIILPITTPTEYAQGYPGVCLDDLNIECTEYHLNPRLLNVEEGIQNVQWYTHLFRSNCPVTGQPDWATIFIDYKGPKINDASLLRYLVSYRMQTEFHEHCVERIFTDIYNLTHPEYLSVYARYTRRGGKDINPYRSTDPNFVANQARTARQ